MGQRRFLLLTGLGLGWLAASLAPTARAQDRIAAEALDPAPMTRGSLLTVYGARELPAKAYALGVLGSYGDKPLAIERSAGGSQLGSLTGSIGTLSFVGALGLGSRIDLGLALPVHRLAEASALGAGVPSAVSSLRVTSSQVALGDIRVVPRVSLLAREGERGFGLAALAQVYLPTGDDKIYAGEAFRVEPRLALDWRSRGGVLLALNLGYLVRARATLLDRRVDDTLRAGVGGEVAIWRGLSGMVEVNTQVNLMSAKLSRADVPTEGFLGVRYRFAGITAQLGGGPGLVRGLTAPSYRMLAAISFTSETAAAAPSPQAVEEEPADDCATDPRSCRAQPPADLDADGIEDTHDSCPAQAEDVDQFQDADGCPEPDNDGDGVEDAADRCPQQVGLASDAGCPPAPPTPSARVVVTEQALELHESVYFAAGRDQIEARSAPLLDDVARALNAHPEITQVVIEGHTDDKGDRAQNLGLSRKRAAAVQSALEQRGVAPGRLRAQGFGPDRPRVANDSDEHRAQNRRVELRIEGRAP